jgi:hypothetical protein
LAIAYLRTGIERATLKYLMLQIDLIGYRLPENWHRKTSIRKDLTLLGQDEKKPALGGLGMS